MKKKPEKTADASRRHHWFPRETPYRSRVITQNRVVLLIGRAAWEICFNQSEALLRSEQ